MKPVRVGVVGLGNMGSFYADRLAKGEVGRASLSAVCDADAGRLARWGDVPRFDSCEAMLAARAVDAVIVATPHYSHTTIGIAALQAGLHVLVDKPISVHKADALCLLAAHADPRQVFAAMFNQRTDGYFLKIREWITRGELGTIRRVNWIITNWFRTAAYYASSPWRATWAGEGGGVLLNQCPHQLDLLCWLVGLPSAVRAHCYFGKYHDIEVEDEVTAYLEYDAGASGVFIAGTGEAPGTNRLEIAGELGKVLLEGDRLSFTRNAVAMSDFSRTTKESFAAPPTETIEFSGLDRGRQHLGILDNFIAAILDDAPLIAPARDGLASVELANAMLYSAFTGERVRLPIDAAAYASALQKRIDDSSRNKTAAASPPADISGSFR